MGDLGGGEERSALCGVCPAGCWVTVVIEEGKIKHVRPHEDHPLGLLCTLGAHSPEIVHDPQRLRHPLRRVGPKGGYEFERISWDDAFEIIVSSLQRTKEQHGPEATAIYTGRGAFERSLCDVFQPEGVVISSASSLLFPFGSPNTLGVGALCYVAFAMIAPHVTMGEMLVTMDWDIEEAEMIIVWGANPATDSPPLVHEQIKRARARGAEVVVIDPRRSETARETDAEWIPVRPGTDGALALGLIQVLLEEELYDEDFAEHWTVGFPELQQYVQHFRAEVVEGITGVPSETIRRLARRLAGARGACPVMYSGLEYSDSGVQAIRAAWILWALAGQLDVPGGLVFRTRENRFPISRDGLIPNPDVGKALGRDRFPIYGHYRGESHAIALPRAILEGEPYEIRSLIIHGGSMITSWPNPSLWRKALGALDFLVCIDRYLTADAAYADIVLPATTMYEITSYMTYGPLFKIREKVVEPQGEARNDFLIMAELADRLGYGHLYPQSEEELLERALRGSGFSVEEVRAAGGSVQIPTAMRQYKKWEKGLLRPDGKPGFNTPTGKFEIASTVLEEHGYDALPIYTEPGEGPLAQPTLAGKYPLVFNSGARVFSDFRSQHHGIPGLSRKAPEPVVTLHASDAAARGIRDGDWVHVVSPRGRVKFRARLSENIVAGVIEANMGGGGPIGPESWQNCNVNELTDLHRYDPISGFPVYKALLCEVARVDGEPRTEPTEVDPAAGQSEAVIIGGIRTTVTPERLVYLDHNATTPVDPDVVEAMRPYLGTRFGNPSSIHSRGDEASTAIEGARRTIAQALGCTARRIVFTGGGSEADNLAVKGVALTRLRGGNHIITNRAEHPAVLASCGALGELGFDVTYLDVDHDGLVDPEELARAITPRTILVSVMTANNEVGTIQPIVELARITRQRDVLFHTDAVQAFGKLPINVEELGVDLLSVSSHKVYGPKGVGALYVRKGVELVPLIHGGGHERGLRSGTENVAGIMGFSRAIELAVRRMNDGETDRLRQLRDLLERGIMEIIPAARRNGHATERLPNTLNMTLPGMRGESLVFALDRRGIHLSSGSACKSGNAEPSPALTAMGLSDEDAHCALRFSLGSSNTEEDIRYVLHSLGEVIQDQKSSVWFVACR